MLLLDDWRVLDRDDEDGLARFPEDEWRALDRDDEDGRARFPEDVFVADLADGRAVRAGDETLTLLELADVDFTG